jgi:hypothetical protein
MAKNIVTLNIDNETYSCRPYVTCSSTKTTVGKTASYSGFTLVEGATILVKFTNGNTATNPTLNVNSTGAKSIYWNNTNVTSDVIVANNIYELYYDGTNWVILGGVNTTYNLSDFISKTDFSNTLYAANAVTTSSITLSQDYTTVVNITNTTSRTISFPSIANDDINISGDKYKYCPVYNLELSFRTLASIGIPSTVRWANGIAPTFEAGKVYQISFTPHMSITGETIYTYLGTWTSFARG